MPNDPFVETNGATLGKPGISNIQLLSRNNKGLQVGLKTGKADDSKTGFELFCYKIVRGGLS
jgi:hypothetical protein